MFWFVLLNAKLWLVAACRVVKWRTQWLSLTSLSAWSSYCPQRLEVHFVGAGHTFSTLSTTGRGKATYLYWLTQKLSALTPLEGDYQQTVCVLLVVCKFHADVNWYYPWGSIYSPFGCFPWYCYGSQDCWLGSFRHCLCTNRHTHLLTVTQTPTHTHTHTRARVQTHTRMHADIH